MTWSTGTYWGNSSTNAGTYVFPVITSGSSSVSFGSGYVPSPPVPRELTLLEWLDAEVEATCAIGRVA